MKDRPGLGIDGTMMRYLLGQMEADEQAELDERTFVDDAWEEARAAAADDLIESYLDGTLDPVQRRAFQAHFLTSSLHRERLELVRDLRTVLDRRETGPSTAAPRSDALSPVGWIAAAAALLAALAGLFVYSRGPAPPKVASATPGPATVTPTPAPTGAAATPTPAPPRTRTASVRVPARPQPLEVAVAADVRTVRFAIPVTDANAPSYSVALRRDGEAVWRRDDLVPRAAGAPVEVAVPAEVLAAGDAELSIEPEATRAATDPAPAVRKWRVRIVRP